MPPLLESLYHMFLNALDPRGFATVWQRQTPALQGILLMCLSTLAFSIMHGLVRFVSEALPPFQIAFFRNLFGLAFLMPLLMRSRFTMLRTNRIGLHALRGVVNILAMLMFFTALSISPLAKVTALSFTAPIFMAVLAVLFLGERFQIYRWLAIFAGFAGMLIILRPGLVALDTGALLVTGSASLWAVAMIIIKILSRTESSVTIVAYMGIFLGLFSVIPAWWVWEPFGLATLGWMILIGLFGSIAQMALSQALKETDPTALMPFDFLKLIWTAIIGAWFFSEIPDVFTWIGAAVIFSSGLAIAFRERQKTGSASKQCLENQE
ncbi:RNA polymerase sigma-54 factor [Sulfitobacter noctilucicola]|uniref:Drug/metabolite transporter (DMT)-like permease n=1 Tax=Sulfitobacter noctilucicola TaxID=1342301 RepID=A0A7W6MBC1_9RHOB|nr:RNA polymerase sigma-54 factor [Sulfitobacter noctilucicola]MBB4175428.1 drug/metabolite transporter (DMT)-like permease [Sulfitobacter noctilucicola]